MCKKEDSINWEKIISLYNIVKELYALCEEIDPELNTNLQPLNEFRAALDHIMRICAIENLEEYKEHSAVSEAKSLYGHLKRAFFDICDLITIHYRNKIIDILSEYEKEDIQCAIPEYYSKIRPQIEEAANNIALFRTAKRFGNNNKDAISEYYELIKELNQYYQTVLRSEPSLIELKKERQDKGRKNKITQIVIPVVSIAVAIAGIIFGVLF